MIRRVLSILFMIAFVSLSVWAAVGQQSNDASAYPDGVARIPVEELKAKFDKKEVIVIDVRAHITNKIKGALHIPLAEIEKHINELPKNKLIVTTCT
ncbi:MAG: rhodanese-like domain-containing protein [Acidobacteriota bacterium]